MNAIEFGLKLAASAVLANFELPPIRRLKLSQPANAAAVTKSLSCAATDSLAKFAHTKSRTAVLVSARNHLRNVRDHEELIVFFGRQRGNGATFDGFWLNRGDRHGVGFSGLALDTIQRLIPRETTEIVVIHNHPPNDLKALLGAWFGWRPLPSSADREIALSHNVPTWIRILRNGFGSRFKWYLVDEGEIAEFYLPSVERCFEIARIVSRARSTSALTDQWVVDGVFAPSMQVTDSTPSKQYSLTCSSPASTTASLLHRRTAQWLVQTQTNYREVMSDVVTLSSARSTRECAFGNAEPLQTMVAFNHCVFT